jgi:hypothetical protein
LRARRDFFWVTANVTATPGTVNAAGAAAADPCAANANDDYSIPLHVAGVFLLFIVSSLGIYGTIALGSSKLKDNPSVLLVLQVLKFFGTGVIVATAWIHMIPSAFAQFSSPCLQGYWMVYGPNYAGLFALIAAFLVQGIEVIMLRLSSSLTSVRWSLMMKSFKYQ